MKTSLNIPENTQTSYLPVFVDISKDHLDYSIGREAGQGPARARRIVYRVNRLEHWIRQLITDYGLEGGHQLQFVCEPTGGLQHKLLLVARRHRARLRFVNTERMYNARMITYGNAEKTDAKDPSAMRNLHLLGQSRSVKAVDDLQQRVRAVSREYEELSYQAIRARNKIQGLLGYVFVDYHKSASFTFSRSGQALASEFSFCPQPMVQAGYEEFSRRLKTHVPRMRWSTLQELWAMAECSVALIGSSPDPRWEQLDWLYRQWVGLEARKEKLKGQLKEYGRLYEDRGWLARHRPPKVSRWMLVRVIAETGQLKKFSHIQALWAYVGLKLARKQSGKYKGQIKITKKGSALARKLLFQICLPLVGPGGCLRASYKRQNPTADKSGKGIRAMTCMMRKLLAILFALNCSGTKFDPLRLGQCESQYKASA